MNTEQQLEILNHIKPTEAPPFLWTRVQQHIINKHAQVIKPKYAIAIGLAMSLIILVNTVTVIQLKNEKTTNESTWVQQMNLDSPNELYK